MLYTISKTFLLARDPPTYPNLNTNTPATHISCIFLYLYLTHLIHSRNTCKLPILCNITYIYK